MKHSGYFLVGILAWATACRAQTEPATASQPETGEFGPTANGLIYSAQTMSKLRHIVDSLNLKHKVCELRRAYRSQRQGQAHYVRLEAADLTLARQALAEGVTPEVFKNRFPKAEIERNLLVVSQQRQGGEYGSASKEPITVYQSIPLNDRGEHELQLPGAQSAQVVAPGRWVVYSSPKTRYSPA